LKHLEPNKIVFIGASTGGPGQIHIILEALECLHNTTIVIAQHMAEEFLASFVERITELYISDVVLIKDGMQMQKNTIYVCRKSVVVTKKRGLLVFNETEYVKHSFNPDINLLFNSIVENSNVKDLLGVLLTGIGDDGVKGCISLSEHGSKCITQTKESAIIDGMPGRAREFVPNIEVYNLKGIINTINEFSD